MNPIGVIILIVIIYFAYQLGRIKGKAEMFLNKEQKQRVRTDKIEEADYEEIK